MWIPSWEYFVFSNTQAPARSFNPFNMWTSTSILPIIGQGAQLLLNTGLRRKHLQRVSQGWCWFLGTLRVRVFWGRCYISPIGLQQSWFLPLRSNLAWLLLCAVFLLGFAVFVDAKLFLKKACRETKQASGILCFCFTAGEGDLESWVNCPLFHVRHVPNPEGASLPHMSPSRSGF